MTIEGDENTATDSLLETRRRDFYQSVKAGIQESAAPAKWHETTWGFGKTEVAQMNAFLSKADDSLQLSRNGESLDKTAIPFRTEFGGAELVTINFSSGKTANVLGNTLPDDHK